MDDAGPEVASPGTVAYVKAFLTSGHLLLYLVSFVIAGSISYWHARLYAKIMVKHRIPVHKGMIPNTIFRTFGAYMFAFVLIFIRNTPIGDTVLGVHEMSVSRQIGFCLSGQTFGCCIDFCCWLVLLKAYLRYQKLQGARMYRTLFGWTKEDVETSWELDDAQKEPVLDVREGAIRLV